MVLIIVGCLAVSALTLLAPSTPTYDPWAWILWGREIAHLDLVTEGGPSWKPLPIFFTVPFSLFGQDLAPYLWLWVARAGGLLGCVMAYRMAFRFVGGRIYGALAGVSAFAALLSSNKYVRDAALGLIPCWYVSENRSSFWKDALIGFGGVGLLYLPWVPTLLHQIQHTGAPWLNSPNFGAPVQITRSLLGGGTPTVALVLAGGSGLAAVIARRVEDRERTAVLAGAVTVLGTLAVAWLVSQVSPAWTTRYLGVLLGPMLLIAAHGRARAGALGFVALAIILSIWAIPRSYGLDNKSNASDLRNASVPLLHEGDLVVSMQPEQGPLLAYHLEDLGGTPKLRFASPIGAVKNDRVMDWTDAYDKLKAATPTKNLQPLLANLPPGGRVLFVYPITSRADDWDAPWTELVRRRGAQWGAALAADKSFKWVAAVPPNYRRATRIGVRGVVYEKKAETG